MKIVAIDCGIRNMAVVSCTVDEMYDITEIDLIRRVDITIFDHSDIAFEHCKLEHTPELPDRIDHFLQSFRGPLGDADVVLIERQPLGGLTSVHDLLYSALRPKGKMINPTSMHRRMNMSGLDYDQRKEFVVNLASESVERFATDPSSYFRLERKHDVADALCMVLYYVKPLRDQALAERRVSSLRARDLDSFRFSNINARWSPYSLR